MDETQKRMLENAARIRQFGSGLTPEEFQAREQFLKQQQRTPQPPMAPSGPPAGIPPQGVMPPPGPMPIRQRPMRQQMIMADALRGGTA